MGKHIQEDNLKTINGESLIGQGDIQISGGSGNSSPKPILVYYNRPRLNDKQDILDYLLQYTDIEDIRLGDYIAYAEGSHVSDYFVSGICSYTDSVYWIFSLQIVLDSNDALIHQGMTKSIAYINIRADVNGTAVTFKESQVGIGQ